jgi:hypothetical protein
MTKRLSQLASEMRPYWLQDIPTQVRPTTGGGTTRGGLNKPYATWVVAAVDSVAPEAANADYVCDGVDDQVQLSAAVAQGGRVVLLDGLFTLSAAVTLSSGVAIVGMGSGMTTLSRAGTIFSGTGIETLQIADMTLAGGGVSIASGATNVDIYRCEFSGASTGVALDTPAGCTVMECRFVDCGTGVSATGPA